MTSNPAGRYSQKFLLDKRLDVLAYKARRDARLAVVDAIAAADAAAGVRYRSSGLDPVRVVLDACVLYPPSLRDLLLTLAALDAFCHRVPPPLMGRDQNTEPRGHFRGEWEQRSERGYGSEGPLTNDGRDGSSRLLRCVSPRVVEF